jgi:hypothetical protein
MNKCERPIHIVRNPQPSKASASGQNGVSHDTFPA